MSEHNSVNEEIRAQREKLKGQGFKAHWEYFWEYYKIHTIVAVVAVIFIVSLISQIANKKPYALYAMFINCAGMDAQINLQDGFYEYTGIDKKAEDIVVDTSSTFSATNLDTYAVATSEKIMALMAASDLDALVADEETFFHFAGQDTFMDLRQVFSPEELESFGDRVFYIDQKYIDYIGSDAYDNFILTNEYDKNDKYAAMSAKYEETGEYVTIPYEDMEEPVPIGIRVDGSSTIETSGAYFENPPVAGIAVNTARIETSKAFIQYLSR